MRKLAIRMNVCVGSIIVLWLATLLPVTASGDVSATTQPAEKAADTVRAAAPDALRDSAIDQVLGGKFEQGLASLQAAAKLRPADAATASALKLVTDYMAVRSRFRKEREDQFDRAVERVRRGTLIDKYFSAEGGEERKKALREKVKEMVAAYGKVADHEALLDGVDGDGVAELKTTSVASLATAIEALGAAVKVVEDDKGPFVDTFGRLAAHLAPLLEKYRAAWQAADTIGAKGRREGAMALKAIEDDLADAVNDVDGMIAKKPWRIALAHARIAREITIDKAGLDKYEWYRDLVKATADRAKVAIEEEEWYDALAAYAGLRELDPDNEEYEDRLKAVRRRVRAIGLYGKAKKPESDNTTAPAESKPRWLEMAEGVDVDTVRTAISQLDDYYVTAIDYRKVIYGGLRSVRTMVELPEASKAFPGLADSKKKEQFLAAVRKELTVVIKKDRLKHGDLLRALINLEAASAVTVEIPTSTLVLEFADGFLDELDRFSSMIWPYDVNDFIKGTMGAFFGVGIQITKQRGQPLKVVSPLADSPAFRAGIKTGDIIVAVDGRRTEDLGIDKLVRKITGEKGTKVVLRIKRPGRPNTIDFEIIRQQIRIRTVKGWRRMPGGDGGRWDYLVDPENKIGYVRVTQFYQQTHAHLVEALKAMKAKGVRSLILDLRFNPGGLLDSAKRVSDEFLPGGKIVSTRGRQKRERVLHATPRGNYLDGELIVLVNGYSASAAEIVSGAVSDLGRGMILGKRTFGKGSVQNVIPIPKHRAYLKLTTAYYYLPNGRCIHRRNGDKVWGVDPDVEVHVTPRQTKRWLDVRSRANLLKDQDPEELDRDLAEEYRSDLQLQTAVLLLRLKQIRGKEAA